MQLLGVGHLYLDSGGQPTFIYVVHITFAFLGFVTTLSAFFFS